MELSAWELCNPTHFRYEVKEEGFMRILDIHVFVNPEHRGRPLAAGAKGRVGKAPNAEFREQTSFLQVKG